MVPASARNWIAVKPINNPVSTENENEKYDNFALRKINQSVSTAARFCSRHPGARLLCAFADGGSGIPDRYGSWQKRSQEHHDWSERHRPRFPAGQQFVGSRSFAALTLWPAPPAKSWAIQYHRRQATRYLPPEARCCCTTDSRCTVHHQRRAASPQ